MFPWKSTEEGIGYCAVAILILGVLYWRRKLTCILIDYQDEKPDEDKNPSDSVFKDMLSTLDAFNYVTVVQLLSCFVPPELWNENLVDFFAYCYYFLVVILLSKGSILVFIKYVFTFQPDDVSNVQASILLPKAKKWGWGIALLAVSLDYFIPVKIEGNWIFTVLMRDATMHSPMFEKGIGYILLWISLFCSGVFFAYTIHGLKREGEEQENFYKNMKKHVLATIPMMLVAILALIAFNMYFNLSVITLHLAISIGFILSLIMPFCYMILQDDKLVLYAKEYGEYPPKVLPWQLPFNWRERNPHIHLEIAGQKCPCHKCFQNA